MMPALNTAGVCWALWAPLGPWLARASGHASMRTPAMAGSPAGCPSRSGTDHGRLATLNEMSLLEGRRIAPARDFWPSFAFLRNLAGWSVTPTGAPNLLLWDDQAVLPADIQRRHRTIQRLRVAHIPVVPVENPEQDVGASRLARVPVTFTGILHQAHGRYDSMLCVGWTRGSAAPPRIRVAIRP